MAFLNAKNTVKLDVNGGSPVATKIDKEKLY